MATPLGQLEIQEIARLLEQGKALPDKYRDILFVDQQPAAAPQQAAPEKSPTEAPPPLSEDTRSATAFVKFLLDQPRIEAVIREYECKVNIRTRYNKTELSNLALGCVSAIHVVVPQIVHQPSGISGLISRWAKRNELPEESAKELLGIIQDRFRRRETQIADEQRAKQVVEETENAERLIAEYSDIVTIFLDIAERKVSVLDEYGDERMHLLDKEVNDCFIKIAGREGHSEIEVRKGLKKYGTAYGLPTGFIRLQAMLKHKFVKHHEGQKGKRQSLEELALLSGVDFETAVGKVLLDNGWQVTATVATGDQGADLIAIKGERRVIIQAKRYTGAVGNKAVQEVVGAIPFYGGTEGCVVTNSTFTPAARALAQKNNIRLIDGSRFGEIAEL
jgi:HJR/Mrr/RecB family endonuclease